MPRFSVSVTDEQDAWVERQAAERDRSKSEIIRLLIDAHRRDGEEFTTAVNSGGSGVVNTGELPTEDRREPATPSTRELAAQLANLAERLEALETAVTSTAADVEHPGVEHSDGEPADATSDTAAESSSGAARGEAAASRRERDASPPRAREQPAADPQPGESQPDESRPDESRPDEPQSDERRSNDDGSGETSAARTIPEPNEDGIIEAESGAPTEGADETSPEPAAGSDGPVAEGRHGTEAAADSAAAPPDETSHDWPTGGGRPDPATLERTAYDGARATSEDVRADTPASTSSAVVDDTEDPADGTGPGDAAAAVEASDAAGTVDAAEASDGADRDGADRDAPAAVEDADLVYAAPDDEGSSGTDAADRADGEGLGGDDVEGESVDGATPDGDAVDGNDVDGDDAPGEAAEADGPFAGLNGGAEPAAVEAAVESAIDDPALAESVFRCWEQLRDRGTAHRRIFKSHYEDIGEGYESSDAWWRDVSDHFEMLPGVEAPAGGGNFYRYRYNR